MNTRSFIFFTRILARAQISSLIFRELFYWGFIGHNFGDYKNQAVRVCLNHFVLSVIILETTKTPDVIVFGGGVFYRSQFWRLQKPFFLTDSTGTCFIGHNFGDYKNLFFNRKKMKYVLSVTILETTKTWNLSKSLDSMFYRSQFWRLQKLLLIFIGYLKSFIGHNFGDYKNQLVSGDQVPVVLSVTILETTKTP